jgi:NAD(P)-dependent dehydrogenase (short-subunit alcohol dehydrogenase family)
MATRSRLLTPFDGESTAMDVLDGVDLSGRRAIVTGADAGSGLETVHALRAAGADVTVAPVDLADQRSVAAFVDAWRGPLHMLVCNASVVAHPTLQRTAEGWELQLAANHLGHFALAEGLRNALARADGARIVSVSSDAHRCAPIDFEDINFRTRPYDPRSAYGQSKTATALFAVDANRRWARDGVFANAVDPGGAPKTAQQRAATPVLLAASPLVDGVGGRYFEDCNEAPPHEPGADRGVAPHALDPFIAARLWELSKRLVRHHARR